MVEIGINQGSIDTSLGLVGGYVVDAHMEKYVDGTPYLYLKIDGKDPTKRKRWAQVIARIEPEIILGLADIVKKSTEQLEGKTDR